MAPALLANAGAARSWREHSRTCMDWLRLADESHAATRGGHTRRPPFARAPHAGGVERWTRVSDAPHAVCRGCGQGRPKSRRMAWQDKAHHQGPSAGACGQGGLPHRFPSADNSAVYVACVLGSVGGVYRTRNSVDFVRTCWCAPTQKRACAHAFACARVPPPQRAHNIGHSTRVCEQQGRRVDLAILKPRLCASPPPRCPPPTPHTFTLLRTDV